MSILTERLCEVGSCLLYGYVSSFNCRNKIRNLSNC